MIVKDKKVFVVLGGFTHEGLTTSVEALGYQLVSLQLDKVGPATWLKRVEQIRKLKDAGELVAIVIYLHTTLLLKASSDKYRAAFRAILNETVGVKTLIFVFQDNLDGVFSIRHFHTREPMTVEDLLDAAKNEVYELSRIKLERTIDRLRDYEKRTEEIQELLNAIYESGVDVAPFFVRSDVTMRLEKFLDDVEQGVFLRLYVPNERLQADQLKGLLSVLERYLRQVEGQNFSIDANKSDLGVTYVFRTRSSGMTIQTLADAFARFDSFMSLCGDNPENATQALQAKGLSDHDATLFVEKYARDYRRLILDTRHEFERKTLLLRQRLETEVIEVGGESIDQRPEGGLGTLLQIATGSNVAINVGSLSIANEFKIRQVERVITGVEYNEIDRQLLAVINNNTNDLQALQYRSDLDQLKDSSASEIARRNSKQRLVAFLRKAAHKAGDVAQKVATEALTKYLESLIKSGG